MTRLCSRSLHPQQLLGFGLRRAADRDLRPRRDDVGDVVRGHFEHVFAGRCVFSPTLASSRCFLEAQLLLAIADRGGLLELLDFDDGVLLGLTLRISLSIFTNRRRRQRRLQAHARGRLVDQVDGLVGQEAIGDVAVAELRRGRERLVGDLHLVVRLVPVAQALENLDRLLDRSARRP